MKATNATIHQTLDLSNVTREQIAKCLRLQDIETDLVYYSVASEKKQNVFYEVRYDGAFGFTCSCPAGVRGFTNCKIGVCKHVVWSLAAAREYKRIQKLDAATVEITEYHNDTRIDTHYTNDNDYHVSFFHRGGSYACSCPVDHSILNKVKTHCPHIQAAKRYREMLQAEMDDWNRSLYSK